MRISDFLLPFFRLKGRSLNFDEFRFFLRICPITIKNLIEPPKKTAGYIVQWRIYNSNKDKDKS